VLHLHDWHTALVAPLFWDIYHHQGMPDTRLMFTWHDAHYQVWIPGGPEAGGAGGMACSATPLMLLYDTSGLPCLDVH